MDDHTVCRAGKRFAIFEADQSDFDCGLSVVQPDIEVFPIDAVGLRYMTPGFDVAQPYVARRGVGETPGEQLYVLLRHRLPGNGFRAGIRIFAVEPEYYLLHPS